jgi:hypothetical protein
VCALKIPEFYGFTFPQSATRCKENFQAGDFFNGEGKSTGQPAKLAAGRVARN